MNQHERKLGEISRVLRRLRAEPFSISIEESAVAIMGVIEAVDMERRSMLKDKLLQAVVDAVNDWENGVHFTALYRRLDELTRIEVGDTGRQSIHDAQDRCIR